MCVQCVDPDPFNPPPKPPPGLTPRIGGAPFASTVQDSWTLDANYFGIPVPTFYGCITGCQSCRDFRNRVREAREAEEEMWAADDEVRYYPYPITPEFDKLMNTPPVFTEAPVETPVTDYVSEAKQTLDVKAAIGILQDYADVIGARVTIDFTYNEA